MTPEQLADKFEIPWCCNGDFIDRGVFNERLAAALAAAEQRGREEERKVVRRCPECGASVPARKKAEGATDANTD